MIVLRHHSMVLAALLVAAAAAPLRSTAQAAKPNIEVLECTVYSPTDQTKRFDCAANVRTACGGKSLCELPIGLALSGGRDLDGNPKNWKKVRVRYRCGASEHVNGPFDQSEHATMVLSCLG